jgi:transcriptional regulator with XRE-family HTH domain
MSYRECKKLKPKSETRIEIAAAIRQGVLLAGLTSEDMAEFLGCSNMQYSKYENGVVNIKLCVLHKIIDGLRRKLTTSQFNAIHLNKYSSQVGLASTLAAHCKQYFGQQINEEALNAIADKVHNELSAELVRDNAKPKEDIIQS